MVNRSGADQQEYRTPTLAAQSIVLTTSMVLDTMLPHAESPREHWPPTPQIAVVPLDKLKIIDVNRQTPFLLPCSDMPFSLHERTNSKFFEHN